MFMYVYEDMTLRGPDILLASTYTYVYSYTCMYVWFQCVLAIHECLMQVCKNIYDGINVCLMYMYGVNVYLLYMNGINMCLLYMYMV